MNRIGLCLAAALCLGLPGASLAEIVEIKGQLAANDPVDPVRLFPCKVHEIKLEKNKKIQIDLISDDFDSYLRLVDGADKELINDDDGGGKNNARIKYLPTADETCKIYVTTYAGGGGEYLLRITTDSPTTNAAEGKIILNVDGALQAGDAPDSVTNNPAKIHELKVKRGSYQVEMNSKQIDSFVRVLGDGDRELAKDDDGGGFPNAKAKFVVEKDTTVKIIASTFKPGQGAYKIIVRHMGDAKGVELAMPTAGKPTEYQGQVKATDEKDKVRPYPSTSHFVELKAGKTYQIDLTSEWDNYLRLENSTGQELAADDDSGGFPNARIVFNCTTDGRYRVIATSFSGGTGQYSLRIAEQ